MWNQQLTHSVRMATGSKGPCMVRVPAPGTWPAVAEVNPQPLESGCMADAMYLLHHYNRKVYGYDYGYIARLLLLRKCRFLRKLAYVHLSTKAETVAEAPSSLEVKNSKAGECFCSNSTSSYMSFPIFLGISDCTTYMTSFGIIRGGNRNKKYILALRTGQERTIEVNGVENRTTYANITLGTFRDYWWVCGSRAYSFLPIGWTGCCYLATLKLPYEVMSIKQKEDNQQDSSNRKRREIAEFHDLESYHFRVSLGEKWGLGLFPLYGVVFLADHIDNITYTLQGFANETIRGFSMLRDTVRSHRMTLLKHEMALDYILARQGGLCITLNLTEGACSTLVPDITDNLTSIIHALGNIKDAFGPSASAGSSTAGWLGSYMGPWWAGLTQTLMPVGIAVGIAICGCIVILPCIKVMMSKWLGAMMGEAEGRSRGNTGGI
ncbi:hypothetical protein SKAU_G00245650 [Synaphobranchus kaupii]|uniref:Envelope glycoprotein n=1 Tax=Synaphobranchus kaupii TaxID=118154 RepID=A0A9Q1F244_SYNKA|nr:hypothetical protein SKAU_G00245650 [Synaphobranchus kaupii]